MVVAYYQSIKVCVGIHRSAKLTSIHCCCVSSDSKGLYDDSGDRCSWTKKR